MRWWILDTDHVSLLLNRHPQVSDRVAEMGADVGITIVTVQELFNGWVVRLNAASEVEDVVQLCGKLSRTIALCKRLPILDFDIKAGNCYQSMLQATPLLARKRV
jgi:tRNA(fMet)-specific endonuclease VapC